LDQKFGQAKIYSAGSAAAMQEIADWLKKLGLGQYAQRSLRTILLLLSRLI
jgi:hypothetical protein